MKLLYKQCIVIRGDLKLSVGKLCVQAAHAAVSSAESARHKKPLWYRRWLSESQKKVVLVVEDESGLEALLAKAAGLKIPASKVVDMGLTEIPPNTWTCVGIGPAPTEILDKVTGNLPLL